MPNIIDYDVNFLESILQAKITTLKQLMELLIFKEVELLKLMIIKLKSNHQNLMITIIIYTYVAYLCVIMNFDVFFQ